MSAVPSQPGILAPAPTRGRYLSTGDCFWCPPMRYGVLHLRALVG